MDVRWQQRFCSYSNALNELQEAVDLAKSRPLTKLEKQGLIQCFEYTHELAWKCIKDFVGEQGNTEIFGSRDALCEAFKLGIVEDGETWMQMIKSRNLTSHIYDQKTADEIAELIINEYIPPFWQLHAFFAGRQDALRTL